MSLAPKEPIWNVLTDSKHARKTYSTRKFCMQKVPAKTPVELKDNAVISIVFTPQPCICIKSELEIHMLSCSCWSSNALSK